MTSMTVLVVVIALLTVAVVGLVGWLSWTAGRLDRLHVRCEGSTAALWAALAERRALALEAAARPGLDPPTAVLLVDAATFGPVAENSSSAWQRESELSEVLRAVWPEVGVGDPWESLSAAATRVSLARRIHNDLVATCLSLRSRRRVRWFRLAGRAPAPQMVAFDDAPPD
jgi:hypothetical protein